MYKQFNPTREMMDALYALEEEDKKKREETKKKIFKKVEFSANNYLSNSLRLENGENEKIVVFRPLPFILEDGSTTMFVKVAAHSVKKGKDFNYYICPKHTKGIEHLELGKECPFCELENRFLTEKKNTTSEEKKKSFGMEAMKNRVVSQWIMRGIERGKEQDGVKFWKFNDVTKGGNYDRIVKLDKLRNKESVDAGDGEYSIFDLEKGKDLNIQLSKSLNKDGKEVVTITTITDAGRETPISKDEETGMKWLTDDKKWFDVFTPKQYDDLRILALGGTPMFNKEFKVWTNKEDFDKIKNAGGNPVYDEENDEWVDEKDYNTKHNKVSEVEEIEKIEETYSNVVENHEVEDELPF